MKISFSLVSSNFHNQNYAKMFQEHCSFILIREAVRGMKILAAQLLKNFSPNAKEKQKKKKFVNVLSVIETALK